MALDFEYLPHEAPLTDCVIRGLSKRHAEQVYSFI